MNYTESKQIQGLIMIINLKKKTPFELVSFSETLECFDFGKCNCRLPLKGFLAPHLNDKLFYLFTVGLYIVFLNPVLCRCSLFNLCNCKNPLPNNPPKYEY